MMPLIVLSLIFFLILALVRLDLAIMAIIIGLPSYLIRFQILGIPFSFLEAMILISFAVWFFGQALPELKNWLKKRKERIPYPFSCEIIALIIISFISVAIANFSSQSLGIWKAYFFEPVLLYILILNVFKTKKDLSKIFWSLLISAAGVAAVAIYQKISGQFIFNDFWAQAETRRVVSWFGYPNAVGLYLAPLTILFTGWFFSLPLKQNLIKSIGKIFLLLTIIASLLSIYFAHSEGALIGLAAGLFVFGLLAGRKQRIVTFIFAALLIGGVFISPQLKDYTSVKFSLNDLSGQIRQRQWKETLNMLSGTKFISGTGLNQYQEAIKPYHQEGIFFNSDNIPNFDEELRNSAELRAKYWQPVEIYLYPHNIFLNFWSELGLLGALLFSWLILKYLFTSFKLSIKYLKEKKTDRYICLGLMCAMIVIVVHGLVDVPYFKNDLSVMFFILLALLGILNLNEKNNKE